MKKIILAMVCSLACLVSANVVQASKVGEAAPAFNARDISGKSVSLSGLKGKYVVLEWHNQGCPYVKKHYNSGNMQKLQREAQAEGAVWVTVITAAKGKQGYVTPAEEKQYLKEKGAHPTHVILDVDGKLGREYGAKTTPHFFIIDPQGTLIYNGAIDDHESTDAADIPNSKNYVTMALQEAMAGKAVSVSSTRPYGCSVKY